MTIQSPETFRLSTKPPSFDRRMFLAAGLAVVVISAAYLGLMYVWITLRESLDDPDYVLRRPLREFFAASVLAMGIAGIFGLAPFRRACHRRPEWALFFMAMGLLMVAVGIFGLLVILPITSDLAGAGGFRPDFGHILTYSNVSGALWLFLLTGAIPFVMGYLTHPQPRPPSSTALLLPVLAFPGYYVGYALYLWWQHITAP